MLNPLMDGMNPPGRLGLEALSDSLGAPAKIKEEILSKPYSPQGWRLSGSFPNKVLPSGVSWSLVLPGT